MKLQFLVGALALALLLLGGGSPVAVADHADHDDICEHDHINKHDDEHDDEHDDDEHHHLPSNGKMYHWIKDLWQMGAASEAGYRQLGSEASHQAEDYVRHRFECLGMNVEVDEVTVPTVWRPLDWGLSVQSSEGTQSLSAYPIQYTASTGPEGVAAALVYVGEGTEQDFAASDVAGKIAVIDIRMPTLPWAITMPTAYLNYDPQGVTPPSWRMLASGLKTNFKDALDRAIAGGALGFIGILKDLPASITDHFGPYDGVLRPIPGLWLDSATGGQLRELLVAGGPVNGEMVLTTSAQAGVASNIIGVLPGQKSDEIIVVESHLDGWAVNDASGIAVVLGLAEHFAQIPPEEREKTLMFVATNRFHGGLGADDFVARHQDLLPNIATVISVEHIGKEYVAQGSELVDTGLVMPRILWVSPGTPLVSYTTDAVVNNDLQRTSVQPAGQDAVSMMWDPPRPIGEASSYYLAGVPVIGYFSWPLTVFTTEHDTPDKVAVDQLRPMTAAFAEIIDRIDVTPLEEIRP